jgi:hypothetical protein
MKTAASPSPEAPAANAAPPVQAECGVLRHFIRRRLAEYVEPSRAGTPRGEPVGYSRAKFHAALLGLTILPLAEQARLTGVRETVISTWRGQPEFKATVERLAAEFADEVVALARKFATEAERKFATEAERQRQELARRPFAEVAREVADAALRERATYIRLVRFRCPEHEVTDAFVDLPIWSPITLVAVMRTLQRRPRLDDATWLAVCEVVVRGVAASPLPGMQAAAARWAAERRRQRPELLRTLARTILDLAVQDDPVRRLALVEYAALLVSEVERMIEDES